MASPKRFGARVKGFNPTKFENVEKVKIDWGRQSKIPISRKAIQKIRTPKWLRVRQRNIGQETMKRCNGKRGKCRPVKTSKSKRFQLSEQLTLLSEYAIDDVLYWKRG